MKDVNGAISGSQPGKEKGVDWDLSRNQARRSVPAGDDLRGDGQRLAAATASTAVFSSVLTPGTRYKWRCIDGAPGNAGLHHYFRTSVGTGTPASATNGYPVHNGDEGYFYVPQDGAWTTISFCATNLTGFLHLIEAREKEESLL